MEETKPKKERKGRITASEKNPMKNDAKSGEEKEEEYKVSQFSFMPGSGGFTQ